MTLVRTLTQTIERAHAAGRQTVDTDRVRLTVYPTDVINVQGLPGGTLDPADLDVVRTALTDLGYAEVESWHAGADASWLTPGLSAGVSLRVVRRGEPSPHNAIGGEPCAECGHRGTDQVPGCTCPGCDGTGRAR